MEELEDAILTLETELAELSGRSHLVTERWINYKLDV